MKIMGGKSTRYPMSERVVWKLLIEKTGASDKVLHESLHKNVDSAVLKSKSVLVYDVPDREEWYERGTRTGYVLDRDEIDRWPIRITVKREEILDET